MKIATRQIPAFLRHPDPEVCAVLVYGPDGGLVKERAAVLARTVVDDPDDPFRVGDLESDRLVDDPARLFDEAAAIALTGGRRLVRVRGATDRLGGLFASFLKDFRGDSFVVVSAGDLSARSTLRKAFESAKNGAALPCYADNAESLEALVRSVLKDAGLTIEADAMAYLQGVLGSDRQLSRRELEKLVLYMGGGEQPVRLSDVEACIGDSAAGNTTDLAFAAAGGRFRELDSMLDRCFQGGDNPVAVLRATANHLQRLHLVAGQRESGIDTAIKRLRPPVFFKYLGAFKAQASRWGENRLAAAMEIVMEAERDCKTTGMPAEAICRQALFRIARGARPPAGRG